MSPHWEIIPDASEAMTLTPDMMSRPPGPGETFCQYHGIARMIDGACESCASELASGARVSCPEHGLHIAEEGVEGCPVCAVNPARPNPTFTPPPDTPAFGTVAKGEAPKKKAG